MFFHSFIAMEYAFTLFFAVNSLINAAGDHLAGGSFPNYVISLCGVVVRCSRVEPMVPGSSPTELFFSFFLFFLFFVLLFSINI